jgi:hypothetical protein
MVSIPGSLRMIYKRYFQGSVVSAIGGIIGTIVSAITSVILIIVNSIVAVSDPLVSIPRLR